MRANLLITPPVSVERLLSFSDNIYAFSMTLLITGLKFPDIPEADVPTRLFSELGYDWRHLAIYVITFLGISSYWVLHHHIYSHIEKSDRGLVWLNILLLLSVTFLPFPTALMGKYGRHASTALIYGITISLNYTFLNIIAWYACRYKHLTHPNVQTLDAFMLQLRLLLPLALVITGTILAQFYTRLSFLLFFLVTVANILPWQNLLARWLVFRAKREQPQ